MEQEGNLDVLPMFEEAVRVVLEVKHAFCSESESVFSFDFVQLTKARAALICLWIPHLVLP